jgi:hypothetical protein
LRRCWYQGAERVAAPAAKRFPVSEKEQTIWNDGASRRRAELVLAEGRLTRPEVVIEEVRSIKLVISEEFENGSVEGVSARLADQVHDSTALAILG